MKENILGQMVEVMKGNGLITKGIKINYKQERAKGSINGLTVKHIQEVLRMIKRMAMVFLTFQMVENMMEIG